MTQEVTPTMQAVALKALEAWKALPEDERNGERPFIMGFNAGWDEGKADAHTEAAELKARVEAAHAAINALCRVLGPVGMALAQRECIGEPLPREAVILSFMGSGASDNVTVGELEDAMVLARQALGGVS